MTSNSDESAYTGKWEPTPEWNQCFKLLLQPEVSEIETNGRGLFFMKRSGKRVHLEDINLDTDEKYIRGIEKSLVPLVKQFNTWDRNKYLFEGPLEFRVDGQRIKGRTHIVLPPAADVPQITIAKKSTSLATLETIAGRGSMALEMKQFIEDAVRARLCINFSGGTGAGKALHKETKIPTPNGFITVEDAEVGTVLFDENGDETKIVKKYCPEDPVSMLLTFKNGEKVKASAGHLWQVKELIDETNESKVVTTQEMFAGLSDNDEIVYAIEPVTNEITYFVNDEKVSVLTQRSKHYIVSIEIVEDDPSDYFCFEVDSESHLFLCTESFIPTHNTTMLEAVSKLIPMQTRIGVAEDTPELELIQQNVSYLHSVPWQPGMDPNAVATLDWCVAQFNRMRTDTLIIGETRGKEFASFLTAANSGMEGCMTTLHANTPPLCLAKMTNFAMKGSDGQSLHSINHDIAHAIDIIVQLIILKDGRHKVGSITEVTNIVNSNETAAITTQELYRYDENTDTFVKENVMTDNLRTLMTKRGVDITRFLDKPPGTVMAPHNNTGESFANAPKARPAGLPTSIRRL